MPHTTGKYRNTTLINSTAVEAERITQENFAHSEYLSS